jgi:ABC-type polysaccharide/polyol phosphate transport system ATPase subunit
MRAGIEAESLGIRFLFDRQHRPVTPGIARLRRRCSSRWGLREVNLSVEPGEAVALVGPNGAGKTTLLRSLAGVYDPDEGRVTVEGRVGSMLAVGAGLMTALTGRENCLLHGVLAGLSRAQSRAVLEEIKRRSELGEAFERLVSSYSQGMRARLGFAVIEQGRPELLLLDEVHQAFDIDFRRELEARAATIVARGGILVAAGHDHAALARLCTRAIHLDRGRLRADGPFEEVLDSYAGPEDERLPARAMGSD